MNTPDNSPDSPEFKQPEGTLEKAIQAAEVILGHLGVEDKPKYSKLEVLSATVGVDSTQLKLTSAPEDAFPTVKVSKPIGNFAQNAAWDYSINYGMQDEHASRNILVRGGDTPTAEVSFYDGSPERGLTELEVQQVADDLARISKIDL